MIINKNNLKIFERERGYVVGNEFYPNSETINIVIPKLLVEHSKSKMESSKSIPTDRSLNKDIKIKSSVKVCNYIPAININSLPEQFDFDIVNNFKIEGETIKEESSLMHSKEPTHPPMTHMIKKPFTLEKGIMSNIYREKLKAGTEVLVSFVGGNIDDVVIDYIYGVHKKR